MTAARYSVRSLEYGQADVRGPEIFWMSHWDEWVTISFSSVLVRDASHCMLINAGMSESDPLLDRIWGDYSGASRARICFSTRVCDQLQALGIALRDVILAPFRAYSVSDIAKFSRATIHMLRSGWAEVHAPLVPMCLTRQVREASAPRKIMEYFVFDARHRVNLLEDEDTVAAGVTSLAAGIHHAESLAVTISTSKGPVIWTNGTLSRENFTSRTRAGLTRSVPESSQRQKFLKDSDATVLPAFDAALTSKLPNGVVAN